MQIYELCYLILPSLAEEQLPEVVGKLKTIVEKAGGKELDGEEPFKIDLAYTMDKTIGASRYVANEAYIGWFKFELEPVKISEVKDEIIKVGEILRHLLIKASRETTFTFAQAKAILAEKENPTVEVGESEPLVEGPVVIPEVIE